MTKEPKIGGSHNLAAAIGVGMGKDQAEQSLINAKKKLGNYDPSTGKRKDFHSPGNAPSTVHFGYENKAEVEPDPSVPMDLSNPLSKSMAIISVSSPNYPSIKSLKETLNEFKIPYQNIEEHFGSDTHALLIGPVNENLAKALAEDAGQENLIYISNPEDIKLVYVNGVNKGSFHKATSVNLLDKPQDNFYSLTKSEKTVSFNFWFSPNLVS